VGHPRGQSPKLLGLGEIERPSHAQGPQNHVEKIGELRVRGVKTSQAEESINSLFFQRHFVGLGHGSDARFLLNQGTSDFALLDFHLIFQDDFFVTVLKFGGKKIPDP